MCLTFLLEEFNKMWFTIVNTINSREVGNTKKNKANQSWEILKKKKSLRGVIYIIIIGNIVTLGIIYLTQPVPKSETLLCNFMKI